MPPTTTMSTTEFLNWTLFLKGCVDLFLDVALHCQVQGPYDNIQEISFEWMKGTAFEGEGR